MGPFNYVIDVTTAKEAIQASDTTRVQIRGRVVGYRRMGGVSFGHVIDNSDTKIQFCFNKRNLPEETYKNWSSLPKLGDIVYLVGEMWTSSTGERTVLVTLVFEVVQATSTPFPDKWNGIVDDEIKRRKRWLDSAVNPEVRARFRYRSHFINTLRSFLNSEDFMEVETPVLTPQASGAAAKSFTTHHNALDADLHLRIAPETYLKRMLVGGFDNVFEIGKQFRNEGMDPSHLQEFTSCEWYSAYATYLDNLKLFQAFLELVILAAPNRQHPNYAIEYQGVILNFEGITITTYMALFEKYGKNPLEMTAKEADTFFKTEIRPNLIQPIFVMDYPAHMSPMAKRKDTDPRFVEQWQFIVNGWELVKCYTELTDPALQRSLLEDQMRERMNGDDETMMLEENFLEALEHGCPPCSGVGIGIDRFVALLTNQTSLRDIVFFPTMKAE